MPAPARSEPAVDSTTPVAPAAGASLGDWLAYVERTHPSSIALGLDRVRRVYERLGLHLDCPVIVVAGTNGKGSTCAMLDAILRAAGYRSALYTSPHLIDFNERARIDGRVADDATLVRALERVEAARNDGEAVALTYFEFTTLAILLVFCEARPDCAILEIGLGGRLDAVNIIDADCAILTSVDLDHQDYLGDTREAIGFEKAHVFRAGRPAVCADPRPPASVAEVAGRIGADLLQLGRDFGYAGQHDRQVSQWKFWMHRPGEPPLTRNGLAYPALRGANQLLNAAAALAALETLRSRLPVAMQAIRAGLLSVEWPGRFQLLPGRPVIVLDVAHNPHAAAALADNLSNIGFASHTHAVFGMLADKDIAGVGRLLAGRIDTWHVATLPGPRGWSAAEQARALRAGGVVGEICEYADPVAAFAAAQDAAGEGDRIVVFGSFLTVAAVSKALRRPASGIPSDDGGSRVRK
ncbi:MAG: bifunctional tetrahydrofolate synthase/dihydrofolate synthase [Burkholderiales bacterium]|nr:bifunctional tetrahydrofolate synthase/dihydrofolate synthase [Burkholderiales bacterium]